MTVLAVMFDLALFEITVAFPSAAALVIVTSLFVLALSTSIPVLIRLTYLISS
jgi:hypothetical protein